MPMIPDFPIHLPERPAYPAMLTRGVVLLETGVIGPDI